MASKKTRLKYNPDLAPLYKSSQQSIDDKNHKQYKTAYKKWAKELKKRGLTVTKLLEMEKMKENGKSAENSANAG